MGDVEDRYGGDYDDHLSPKGIQQRKALAQELADKGIQLIFSSPLLRARECAEIISQNRIPIVYEEGFRERNQYGILSGMVKSEAREKYGGLVVRLNDRNNTIEGAESYSDFTNKLHQSFEKLQNDLQHNCIAIVWHGGTMRAFFSEIVKWGELKNPLGDCAWAMLKFDGDSFELLESHRMKFL